jgi:cell division protein FtsQ
VTGVLSRGTPRTGGRRRPGRRVLVGGGAVLVLLAVAVWVVGFSSLLGVRSLAVRGVSTADPAAIRAAAAVPPGTPLFRVDTAAVARRVERVPAVASASVHVSYPSTVVITVVERVAVGYVRQGGPGGPVELVDATGTAFRQVTAPPAGLPKVDLGAGDPRAATAAASTVAGALTPAERAAVDTVRVDAGSGGAPAVSLGLTDGRRVLWGGAERSVEKARLLAPLLGQPGKSIDLSDPDLVVVR